MLATVTLFFKKIKYATPSKLWWNARRHVVGRLVFLLLTFPLVGYPLGLLSKTLASIFRGLSFGFSWFHDHLPYEIFKHDKNLLDPRFVGTNNSPYTSFVRYLSALEAQVKRSKLQPKFSIIFIFERVNVDNLRRALDSVLYQIYQNWEICIEITTPIDPVVNALLSKYLERLGPNRFKFICRTPSLNISASSDSAIGIAVGDYLVFLEQQELLYPNALAEAVRHVNRFDRPLILYSDERTVEGNGKNRFEPFYKPDFSRHLLNSVNFLGQLLVVDRSTFNQVGGFRSGFEGVQRHDLILRVIDKTKCVPVHIPMCLCESHTKTRSTPTENNLFSNTLISGQRAISESLERQGRKATVSVDRSTNHFRVHYEISSPKPLVSILIPSRDNYFCLSRCLSSIFSKSTYPSFEVLLLDNETKEPNTIELLKRYRRDFPDRFFLFDCPGSFNFNAFNNYGAKRARGDYFILLNNDTEVITDNWIEELLSLAQLPEIGAVGAKLFYEDRTIQHAGVLLFGKEIAGHANLGWPSTRSSTSSFINTVHEVSAVTAACLMIHKEKYFSVGGLDEMWLPNGWGDVDFCLRLRAKGFTHLFNPYAQLFHYESKSRGTSFERFEFIEMLRRHGHILVQDPYLNPNLRFGGDYDLDPLYSAADPSATTIEQLLKNNQNIFSGKLDCL